MRRMEQKTAAPWEEGAELGVVTIGGNPAAVETRGEVRNLPVYGPGGYLWAPANGAAVLVVKGGPGGEEQCVAGTRPAKAPVNVLPGEVCLYGPGGNSVYLRQDGSVEIRGGKVSISGELEINGQPYQPCAC